MIRKFKTLGLALVAVLALSAVVASAASAANYTASSYPVTGTATSAVGNDIFTTEAGTVECAGHFEGTLTEASTSLTVKAKYTGCKAFGFASATVSMNSCDYLFTEPAKQSAHNISTGLGEWTMQADVRCTGAPITIVAGNCEVTVGEQNPGGHATATNVATTTTPTHVPAHVNVKATVEGVNYTVTKDGFLCPFAGTGAKAGATYKQGNGIAFIPTTTVDSDIG